MLFDIQTCREAFEAAVGPMPEDCIWAGNGYAATQYNAWRVHEYIQQFDGWKKAWQAMQPAQRAAICAASVPSAASRVRALADQHQLLPDVPQADLHARLAVGSDTDDETRALLRQLESAGHLTGEQASVLATTHRRERAEQAIRFRALKAAERQGIASARAGGVNLDVRQE